MSAPKVGVLAGLTLAASDCVAQGNLMAANELLDIKFAVSELIDAAREYRIGTDCHVRDCVHCFDRSVRIDMALANIGPQS